MARPSALLLGLAGGFAAFGSAAQASSLAALPARPAALAPAMVLREARTVPAPLAFVQFCLRHQEACLSDGRAPQVALTAERREELASVNHMVNRRIEPDPHKGGFDWSLDTTIGNCNDYAVQKQQELIARGYPRGALSLTVAITGKGIGHLVLTVRTDQGDYVLDNLHDDVRPAARVPYRWVKRQSGDDPRIWTAVHLARLPVRPAPDADRVAAERRPTIALVASLGLRPTIEPAAIAERSAEALPPQTTGSDPATVSPIERDSSQH